MTIVLGVDPGSRITGWGAVRLDEARLSPVDFGCIRAAGETLAERLAAIHAELSAIVLRIAPDEAAIERVFLARSVDSALKLGHARGAALAALSSGGMAIHEYAPRAIKQAVTGAGGADKLQVQQMVTRLLGLEAPPQADAADALAVAICHGHLHAVERRTGTPPARRGRSGRRWRLPG